MSFFLVVLSWKAVFAFLTGLAIVQEQNKTLLQPCWLLHDHADTWVRKFTSVSKIFEVIQIENCLQKLACGLPNQCCSLRHILLVKTQLSLVLAWTSFLTSSYS